MPLNVATSVQLLVNGQAGGALPALDRGLAYGDGVFRTLRIDAAQPRWLAAQLAHLRADAQRLYLPCPADTVWHDDLARLALPEHGILRLTLTRGVGERGYAPSPAAVTTRIVAVWPGAALPTQPEAIAARVCALRLASQPALAGIKHLNRLENVLARSEWTDTDIAEGVLMDAEDRVVSGVAGNLFIWRDNVLTTPRLDRCGVAGRARVRLMQLASQAGLAVREADVSLNDVLTADEVMFSNSVHLLRRVIRLDVQPETRTWEAPVISPQLWEMLRA